MAKQDIIILGLHPSKAPGKKKKAAEQVARYFADIAALEAADADPRPEAVYEGDDALIDENIEGRTTAETPVVEPSDA